MKNRTKALLISLFCFFAALSYFFLSYRPLNTELQLTPEWTCDIATAPSKIDGSEIPLPFRLGQYTGYFTPTGKIILNERIQYKATTSQYFYALYNNNAENIPVLKPDGTQQCVIQGAGFPFIQQDRIYLMLPGGASFAVVNSADGSLSKIYEYISPITTFNSSQGGISVGFADGTFLIFDTEGNLKQTLTPGGSKYPVILGGNISNNGKFFACVSGIEPQRFVLYKDEVTYEKIIFHEFLKSELKRQIYVHFSNDDRFVYFDSADALVIVDIEALEAEYIPTSGIVLDIQESPVNNTVFVLCRDKNEYCVTILEEHKRVSGKFVFDAQAAFIQAQGDSLFVGRDNKISRITISKE